MAYPIKKPKNPPIPMEVANPPIPIEVARELKSTNIPMNYPRDHKYMQYRHFSSILLTGNSYGFFSRNLNSNNI